MGKTERGLVLLLFLKIRISGIDTFSINYMLTSGSNECIETVQGAITELISTKPKRYESMHVFLFLV